MSTPLKAIDEFKAVGADKLLGLLKSLSILQDEESSGVVYALLEIANSVAKVYSELIPEILVNPDAPVLTVKEKIWDIREEFRHIDYHIHDGGLTEL